MTRMIFFSYTESHEYLEWDSTNSYHPNQLNQEKKENRHVKFQNMACIYMWREENNNNNSHPKLNMCIFLYLYFEIKRLLWYPHISPLQHEIEPPLSCSLLYRAFLAKERSLMHWNILLRVSYLLQRAATHLLRIFKGTFFTIEKDTTKSLGLRGIKTSANGGTKWRQISKIAFGRNQKFFSGNVIALWVDSDEKIKKFE